jgi:membrane-bound metal-dependent hydrolase YbcI (DUF457 family)
MTLFLILILLALVWYSTIPNPFRLGVFVVLIVLLVIAVLGYAGAPILPPHWR